MSFEVVRTRGGARAMLDRASGEIMHPVGPVQEALQLYLSPSRLSARLAEGPVVVFDVGLGAGSNAAASWRASEARAEGPRMELVSFDRTAEAMALALREAPEAFGFDAAAREAAQALLSAGEACTERTRWRLVQGDLPSALAQARLRADVVFWDPYSPKVNPELWGFEAFTALFAACGPRATVHTYGAATSVRSALLLAGFWVGFGPATGTKGETTVAAVARGDLEAPLDARWHARLQRSSAPLPADAPPDALARVAARFSTDVG